MKIRVRKKLLFVLVSLGLFVVFAAATAGSFFGFKLAQNPQLLKNLYHLYVQKQETPELTDEEIVKRIVDETPALKDNEAVSQFEIVSAIREWTFSNVPVVFSDAELFVETVGGVTSAVQIPLSQRLSLFETGEAGAQCGATATTLRDIYELFGFEAFTVNAGQVADKPPQPTHILTLVKINHDGREILSVQDSFFNYTLVNRDGNPLDYFEMLSLLKQKRHQDFYPLLGSAEFKPRLIAKGTEENVTAEKVFANGNKLVSERFILPEDLPGYDAAATEFLTQHGYPANFLYLHLFPFGMHGRDYVEYNAILNKARVITGTWCYRSGECWGLEEVN